MKSGELSWTELLILLVIITVGISSLSFYSVSRLIEYDSMPLLIMQMLGIIIQLVIVVVVYKIYLLVREELKK